MLLGFDVDGQRERFNGKLRRQKFALLPAPVLTTSYFAAIGIGKTRIVAYRISNALSTRIRTHAEIVACGRT
jgi:hypothetical protein